MRFREATFLDNPLVPQQLRDNVVRLHVVPAGAGGPNASASDSASSVTVPAGSSFASAGPLDPQSKYIINVSTLFFVHVFFHICKRQGHKANSGSENGPILGPPDPRNTYTYTYN